MRITVLLSEEEEFIIGQSKEFPSVMTQGKTIAEIMENINDALNLVVEDSSEEAVRS